MRFLDEGDPRRMVWEKCESPIEQLMCTALFSLLGIGAIWGDYSGDRLVSMAERLDGAPGAFLFSQHPVGRYRLDFLVAAVDPIKRRARLLGIECDGKAYHGSAEQQERDRLRERWIMPAIGQGFQMFRYTGAELRHGMRRAVGEVSDWLWERGVIPHEAEGAWLVDMNTPGKPDLRVPYHDQAAEDEEFRERFAREGFV
jgi:very-short-patch-repair endonuclease